MVSVMPMKKQNKTHGHTQRLQGNLVKPVETTPPPQSQLEVCLTNEGWSLLGRSDVVSLFRKNKKRTHAVQQTLPFSILYCISEKNETRKCPKRLLAKIWSVPVLNPVFPSFEWVLKVLNDSKKKSHTKFKCFKIKDVLKQKNI